MKLTTFVLLGVLLGPTVVDARPRHTASPRVAHEKTPRHQAAKRAFLRQHGLTRVPPNTVVDHVVPLCAGGADDPSNMQLQDRAESLIKDRIERAQCAALRKAR